MERSVAKLQNMAAAAQYTVSKQVGFCYIAPDFDRFWDSVFRPGNGSPSATNVDLGVLVVIGYQKC